MGLDLKYINHQTALDEDEKEGLLIKSISTRAELDEFEQQNIERAIAWTMKKRFKIKDILSEDFVRKLHKKMFDQTWRWAGEYRKSNKNIGVDKFYIGIELKNLLDDCIFWVEHQSFEPDEIAIRFKHRMVHIHPFPNGNGRHSRLIADVLIEHGFGRPVFSWGSGALELQSNLRREYLNALFEADKDNYKPLINFARK
ncbi:MAG: mobile mystery protein B [Bacteroidales bacterium]|nr:mobile mystery protein B [Bacteroidales bacterium]